MKLKDITMNDSVCTDKVAEYEDRRPTVIFSGDTYYESVSIPTVYVSKSGLFIKQVYSGEIPYLKPDNPNRGSILIRKNGEIVNYVTKIRLYAEVFIPNPQNLKFPVHAGIKGLLSKDNITWRNYNTTSHIKNYVLKNENRTSYAETVRGVLEATGIIPVIDKKDLTKEMIRALEKYRKYFQKHPVVNINGYEVTSI
jgi:hypothetical protein